jgi:steroid 5-alpha reductase family enzyme
MLTEVFLNNFIVLNLFFIWAWIKDDLGVIDIYWGVGFSVICVSAYLKMSAPNVAHAILMGMVLAWSVRLAGYLFIRWMGHDKEDPRYTAMRKEWKGPQFFNAYYRVFLLQFVLMAIIVIPEYQFFQNISAQLSVLKDIGVAIFAFGLIWETIADWSLYLFKRNPANKGKRYTKGVWKYSRHPNYFGEITLWWGLYLYCVENVPWWSFIGPLMITFFILKVSGIPMLNIEERYSNDPAVAEYQRKTNLFFPWFPKK